MEMMNQLKKQPKPKAVTETSVDFAPAAHLGKKRSQHEAYLDDLEKLAQSFRKKKQKSSGNECEYDLVPNKEIRKNNNNT